MEVPEGVALFVPPVYDLVWTVLVLAQAALLVTALVVWFRERREGRDGLLELLVIVLLPVVGPAAYLVATRIARRRRSQPESRTVLV